MPINALKVISEISNPFIVAGTPFTITTVVTNLHEEKIEILEYFFHIPYQVQWIQDEKYTEAYEKLKKKNAFIQKFSRSPWIDAAWPPGQNMQLADRDTPPKPIQEILSGEAVSHSFTALVPKWLFAVGREIKFDGLITYLYKSEKHTSPFTVTFSLKPPLASNIIGAIVGGLLGSIAKSFTPPSITFDLSILASSVLSIILGVIIIVFSSRRSGGQQPMITIEDIWGGLLAGFFVGYLGHEFFYKVVPLP